MILRFGVLTRVHYVQCSAHDCVVSVAIPHVLTLFCVLRLQNPPLPQFEGHDLKRLGQEISMARQYLQQSRTYRTAYEALKTPRDQPHDCTSFAHVTLFPQVHMFFICVVIPSYVTRVMCTFTFYCL